MSNNATTKKYILKPGMHQFAPGSAAIHCDENLSDDEAEWYIERYPHIKTLFASQPADEHVKEVSPLKQTAEVSKRKKTGDKGGEL